MIDSPLQAETFIMLGPIPITPVLLTTWGLMIALVLGAYVNHRRLEKSPGKWQVILELLVTGIERQINFVSGEAPRSLVPLIGTLFIFLTASNVLTVVPILEAPTARLETAAALALIVFLSVHYYGISALGLRVHLKRYLQPNIFLTPFNLLSEITRTFALMVRLFGNMMSTQFLGAVLIALAGLLVPVPFMVLDLVIGLLQAYIFSVLATVFIAAALHSHQAIGAQSA